MKNAMTFIGILLVSFLSAQEVYEVRTIEMKSDMSGKAMKLGKKYFSGSLEKLGVDGIVLQGVTGPIHGLVIYSVPSEDPFINRYSAMRPHMVEIAGSEEKMVEDIAMYNSAVDQQQLNIFQGQTEHKFTDAPYYKVRFIKFKHGMKQTCLDIGMKYFSAGLKELGVNAKVLSSSSGPWDLIVLQPKQDKNPIADEFAGQYDEIYQALAGSEEQLDKDLKTYSDGVLREEIHFFRKI